MPVFSGNTSTSDTSTAFDIPATIKSFSIVNKSGSTANVTVSIIYGSTNIAIYKAALTSGTPTYVEEVERLLPASAVIYFLTDQNCDFYFSIK